MELCTGSCWNTALISLFHSVCLSHEDNTHRMFLTIKKMSISKVLCRHKKSLWLLQCLQCLQSYKIPSALIVFSIIPCKTFPNAGNYWASSQELLNPATVLREPWRRELREEMSTSINVAEPSSTNANARSCISVEANPITNTRWEMKESTQWNCFSLWKETYNYC